MSLTACFLRAVNVGGRRATNDDLVSAATTAGFERVATYQAAGNLVLDPGGRDEHAVAAALEDALRAVLGFTTEVVVRDGPQLRAALAVVPWGDQQVEQALGKPQVLLCRTTPDAQTAQRALALSTPADPLVLVGRDLHWLPTAGTGRSALDTRQLQELLHPATARTVGTLERLVERFLTA